MAESIYSVWALPPETITQRLKNIMTALRSEFGGPDFAPHITVVGATRLPQDLAVQRLRAAASSLKPYPVHVSSVSTGKSFFQSVYLLVDPSPEVISARSRCLEHFGGDEHYMPHLSLLYGDVSEAERRRAAEMAESLDNGLVRLSFPIATLALYKTDTSDKTLESWEKIAVIELSEH